MSEYIVDFSLAKEPQEGETSMYIICHDRLEEIVRCCDCQYGSKDLDEQDIICIFWPQETCGCCYANVKPDGFCFEGKKKGRAE